MTPPVGHLQAMALMIKRVSNLLPAKRSAPRWLVWTPRRATPAIARKWRGRRLLSIKILVGNEQRPR